MTTISDLFSATIFLCDYTTLCKFYSLQNCCTKLSVYPIGSAKFRYKISKNIFIKLIHHEIIGDRRRRFKNILFLVYWNRSKFALGFGKSYWLMLNIDGKFEIVKLCHRMYTAVNTFVLKLVNYMQAGIKRKGWNALFCHALYICIYVHISLKMS